MNLDRIIKEEAQIVVSVDKTKYKNPYPNLLEELYPRQYKSMELLSVEDNDGYINYTFNSKGHREFNVENFSILEKLTAVYSLFDYEKLFDAGFQTSFEDENIFLDYSNTICVLFIEKKDLYKYDDVETDLFYNQLKSRVLSMFTKYSYEEIIKSNFTLNFKTEFENEVLNSATVSELKAVIEKYIVLKKEEEEKEFVFVKKKNFVLYRMLTFIFIVGFVVVSGILAYTQLVKVNTLTFDNEIYSEFIHRNYSKVIEISKEETLGREQKYLVGYSAIMTSALDEGKRKVILATYSKDSNESLLEYWVYIGYGNYGEAIKKGKALNNDEYVLYALRLEENRLLNDVSMDGGEKESELKSVRDQIKTYEDNLRVEVVEVPEEVVEVEEEVLGDE